MYTLTLQYKSLCLQWKVSAVQSRWPLIKSLSYLDHQVPRRVSGHSGKFIRQLFECWTDILVNHPA